MEIQFETQITAQHTVTVAELAWLTTRPELGLLCRAVGDERLDAERVASLLPGVSPQGAKHLGRWCQTLGLVDRDGYLTGLGRHAGENDEVPIPEQGVYDLWTVRHPLMGDRLLHAARSTDRGERGEARRLTLGPQSPHTSVVKTGERVVFRRELRNHSGSISSRRVGAETMRLTMTWDLDGDQSRWQLHGRLAKRAIQHRSELAAHCPSDLMPAFSRTALRTHGVWDPTDRHLAVAFDTVSDQERASFRRELQLANVRIEGIGDFRSAHLRDVPLKPASPSDAQAWAEARLFARLRGDVRYRTRDEVSALWRSLVDNTPLAPFAPELPSQETLLEQLEDTPDVFWSLAAAEDLRHTAA